MSVAFLLATAGAWAQVGSRFEFSAPARAIADGRTPVKIGFKLRPLSDPPAGTVLKARANAGTLGPVIRTGPGSYELDFVPPRLGARRSVEITVSQRLGAAELSGQCVVGVEPADDPALEVTAKGPLHLRGPARVTLGRVPSFEISLDLPPGPAPVLLVNVGKISALSAGQPGRLKATYTPPDAIFPQVAIIAIVDAYGSLLDWMLVQLDGQGEIDAQTEPHASVRVRVGDIEFGPVDSDARGHSKTSIVAPPGIKTAVAIASDALGNVKERPLDLGVPPYLRLLGTCPPRGDRMLLVAVDARGNPLVGEPFELEAKPGKLEAAKMLAPGAYETILKLPAQTPVGQEIALQARLATDRLSTASCRIKVTSGLATQARMKLESSTYLAGTGPVAITIEVLDEAGRPAQSPQLQLTADWGEVSPPRPLGPGQYTAQWRLPDTFDGRRAARVSLVGEEHRFSADAEIELKPGKLARLAVVATPTALVADGRAASQMLIRPLDAYENPVPAQALSIHANGTVSAPEDNGAGSLRATYTAPFDSPGPQDQVVVRDDRAAVETTVPIDLLPNRWQFNAGARVGYSTNLAKVSSVAIAAELMVRPPALGGRLSLGVEAAFARSLHEQLDASGTEPVRSELWWVPLLARGSVRILREPVGLYLGASLGLAICGRSVSSKSSGERAWTATRFGAGGHLGADKVLGPGRIVAELAYLYTKVPGPSGNEPLSILSASGGYRFEF
jgi:hypothetical protein